MVSPNIEAGLFLIAAAITLWSTSNYRVYRILSLRDSLWFLMHIDRAGFAAFVALIAADINLFMLTT